jgi:hypothetical protein
MVDHYDGAKIIDIRRGLKSQNRDHIIYARLVDKNGQLLISSTLQYITAALNERLQPTEG